MKDKHVIVELRENNSNYVLGQYRFVVIKSTALKYIVGQHFDLAQFEYCALNGIGVLLQSN